MLNDQINLIKMKLSFSSAGRQYCWIIRQIDSIYPELLLADLIQRCRRVFRAPGKANSLTKARNNHQYQNTGRIKQWQVPIIM